MHPKTDLQEFKVGLFVLAVVFISCFLIFFVAVKKELFSSRVPYFLMSTTGENIDPGIPVKLSGIKIGQVSRIELEPSGTARVEIEIRENYREWVTLGTRTSLSREGVIGGTYIKLIPGPRTNDILAVKSRIPLDREGGIEEKMRETLKTAEPVIEDLKVTVANIRTMTDQFVDPQGSIQRLISNADQVSAMLVSNEGLLNYVTRDKRAVEKIESILSRIDTISTNLDQLLARTSVKVDEMVPVIQKETVSILSDIRALVKDFKALRDQLGPAIQNVDQITENIKRATTDLDRVREEGEYTLRMGSELLQRLEHTWPLGEKEEPRKPREHPLP
jgi:phospholipid/cholesterol/gamma-HCH transport system substrate-binding protein